MSMNYEDYGMYGRLIAILKEVSEELKVTITREDVADVMYLCWRKMDVIKKPESYLPTLFRCELKIKLQAKAINKISKICEDARKEAENHVLNMPFIPMQPQMSQCT